MARRSPARFLAPIALATCAVAAYAVIHAGTRSHHHDAAAPAAATAKHHAHKTRHRTYTVKSGDVLSSIAQRTGVSVDHLQRLNPSMSPEALHPGEKIKLR